MDRVTWISGEKLQSIEELLAFEDQYKVKFPDKYKEIVTANDGASPVPQNFHVADTERVFNYLVKVSDLQTMFANICREYSSAKILVPFADDPAGNFICFDFTDDKTSPKVVFFELDRGQCLKIADNFTAFLNSLT